MSELLGGGGTQIAKHIQKDLNENVLKLAGKDLGKISCSILNENLS